jgi:hypothetical protein
VTTRRRRLPHCTYSSEPPISNTACRCRCRCRCSSVASFFNALSTTTYHIASSLNDTAARSLCRPAARALPANTMLVIPTLAPIYSSNKRSCTQRQLHCTCAARMHPLRETDDPPRDGREGHDAQCWCPRVHGHLKMGYDGISRCHHEPFFNAILSSFRCTLQPDRPRPTTIPLVAPLAARCRPCQLLAACNGRQMPATP